MHAIQLNERWIGDNEPCFIIAEVGTNHSGSLDSAHQFIDAIDQIGADAIKFQTFKAEKIASLAATPKMFSTLRKFELPRDWHRELKEHADKLGLIFLSTPFDSESADLLDGIGVPGFKIASGDLTYLQLLQHIARKKKPMIISTGGANLKEIEEALEIISQQGNSQIVLMHCVSNYPTRIEDTNIRAIVAMRKAFNLPIGYSDHSLGSFAALLAIAVGAVAVEKHVTFDRSAKESGHAFAMEIDEFGRMVEAIRLAEQALSNGEKRCLEVESDEIMLARRSLFARIKIPKGDRITPEMIKIVRPAIGLLPKHLSNIVGKRAMTDIPKDTVIKFDSVEEVQ